MNLKSRPHPTVFLSAFLMLACCMSASVKYGVGAEGVFSYSIMFFAFIAFIAPSAGLSVLVSGLLSYQKPVNRLNGYPGSDNGLATAILIPCYMEDMHDVLRRISLIKGDLRNSALKWNRQDKFSFFILSDTQDKEAARMEEILFQSFSQSGNTDFPVFYRCRNNNLRRKSGNIDEWVDGIGRSFDIMVILDADSMISGEWLLSTQSCFASQPDLGLVQAMIYVEPGENSWSRIAAFGSSLCGKLYARGIAAWSGCNAPYWGHNAMLRISAYQSARLPVFSDGSTYLSHDVVEAAFMSKAGWKTVLDSEETGSLEGTPPDPAASDARETRWCKGNLQHCSLIFSAGLTLTSRIHIAMGILHYFSAPAALISAMCIGMVVHIQTTDIKIPFIVFPIIFTAILPLLAGVAVRIHAGTVTKRTLVCTVFTAVMSIVSWPSAVVGGTFIFLRAFSGGCHWNPARRKAEKAETIWSVSCLPMVSFICLATAWTCSSIMVAAVTAVVQWICCIISAKMSEVGVSDIRQQENKIISGENIRALPV